MNVLVVDDSVVFRVSIFEAITKVDGIHPVAKVNNGRAAVEFLQKNQNIDVITLDMEMPVLDGLGAIKEIRKFNKDVFIIVFSSITLKGAEATMKALQAGANDFVTKQEVSGSDLKQNQQMIKDLLVPKLLCIQEQLQRKKQKNPASDMSISIDSKIDEVNNNDATLLVIASSTGGPDALCNIFRNVTIAPKVPILLIQHMPPIFTQKLAELLTSLSTVIEFKEAKDMDTLKPGVCYIAPGDYHMEITNSLKIQLNQNEKVCFVRPSANVTFESIAKNYKGKVLSLVLTGMGEDGASGVRSLADKGNDVYVQDESTSVVWGMPKATKKVVPKAREITIHDIPHMLNNFFKQAS